MSKIEFPERKQPKIIKYDLPQLKHFPNWKPEHACEILEYVIKCYTTRVFPVIRRERPGVYEIRHTPCIHNFIPEEYYNVFDSLMKKIEDEYVGHFKSLFKEDKFIYEFDKGEETLLEIEAEIKRCVDILESNIDTSLVTIMRRILLDPYYNGGIGIITSISFHKGGIE